MRWRLISYDSYETRCLKTTFDQYTELAKDAFKALGVATDSIDEVKSLPESHFPTEEVARLEREIELSKSVQTKESARLKREIKLWKRIVFLD